jgi:hypothetical protein
MRSIHGKPSRAITDLLGFTLGDAVVHRDDLVLLDDTVRIHGQENAHT